MKTRWWLFVLVFLGVFIANSAYAQTYIWKKYDDFSSGVIDITKWDIDDSSATITIENGRAKFVHNPGFANDSAWLKVIKKNTNIWGIKATVEFESCNFADPTERDVRARIGANIGTEAATPTNRVYAALNLEPYYNNGDSPKLHGFINVWDTIPNPDVSVRDIFSCNFPREDGAVPADFIGIPFTITQEWTAKSVKFTVLDQGKATYNYDKTYKVKPITDPDMVLVGIGTSSNSGGGTCTIYFDDVYVLRKY
jgi:hypothetical protein